MLNLERNNVVQVKTLEEFKRDISSKKCSTNSYGDIYYKSSNLAFTDAMKRFCGMYFSVHKYVSDNEIYLYAEDIELQGIEKYVFTADMINVYEGPTDEEDSDEFSTQNYLDIIALINKEEQTLIEKKNLIMYNPELNDQYILDRITYLDKIKNIICKKIMK